MRHPAVIRRLATPALLLSLLALLTGCDNTEPFETRCTALSACLCAAPPCSVDQPTLGPSTQVVPDEAAMPGAVESQPAHNNLDIIWHDGRLFFAFRTAPSHFASEETMLYIVSTTDQVEWRYEGVFAEGRDLREPRFLSMNGRLFLHYARLGTSSIDFEPGGAVMREYNGPTDWSEAAELFPEGFIPWRFQHRDGEAWLIGYTGGADIYDTGEAEVIVRLYRSRDGLDWRPAAGDDGVVLRGGVSETAFDFTEGGDIIAVGRNEAGDADGFGSKICRASAGDLGAWTCQTDPKKYDSPLLFRHGSTFYLVGRRNLNETGAFDLGGDGSIGARRLRYLADYWVNAKRCALWTVDPEALTVSHVLDLPSAGDTCFASVVPLDADQYLLYDYTAPLSNPDIAWMDAQLGPTLIHRMTLALP